MKTTTLIPLLLTLTTSTTACLTDIERHGGHILSQDQLLLRRQQDNGNLTNDNTIPIGKGDRFSKGTKAPRGIGSRPYSETTNITNNPDLSTVYSVPEIRSALLGLQHEFPSQVSYFELPHKTHLNATMFGAKISSKSSKSNKKSYSILLESAIHARERGGPDYLINFISDLLHADRLSLPALTYGGTSYPLSQIRSVLALGIVIIPLVNPDGVSHDHATNSCWRKNRNPASQIPSDPIFSIGVDLNRNFAPVWNFTKYLAPEVESASLDPTSEIFAGTAALSEQESKNIDWTMSTFPDLSWFVDLHSIAGLVLYGWGHDSNQATDPSMNWSNPKYDGKRGVIPDDPARNLVYKEYFPDKEWDTAAVVAGRVASRMTDSTSRSYEAIQAPHLYPVSGSVMDHPKWRKAVGKSKKTVNGLTIEFGGENPEAECPFYPSVEMHRLNMIETGAGFMEVLLGAVRFK